MKNLLQYARQIRPSLKIVGGIYAVDTPINHVIRGLCLDKSLIGRSSYYVSAFYLLAFVPTDVLHITHGFRLGEAGELFSSETEGEVTRFLELLREVAFPFLDDRSNAELATQKMIQSMKVPNDINSLEQCAYGLAYLENYRESEKYLDLLISLIDPEDKRRWLVARLNRAQKLLSAIRATPSDVKNLLSENELDTLTACKLTQLA